MASQVTFNGQTADAVYVVNPSDGSPGSPGSSLTQAETQAAVEDAIAASADIEEIKNAVNIGAVEEGGNLDTVALNTNPGTPITAATMPAGGTGPLGWLSGIWVQATALLASVGAPADAAATSNTGTFSLIALIKRGVRQLSNLHEVNCNSKSLFNFADNANISLVIPAQGANTAIVITTIVASFGLRPSAGRPINVVEGSTIALATSLSEAGIAPINFRYTAAANTALTVSLGASGAGGNIGSINVFYSVINL